MVFDRAKGAAAEPRTPPRQPPSRRSMVWPATKSRCQVVWTSFCRGTPCFTNCTTGATMLLWAPWPGGAGVRASGMPHRSPRGLSSAVLAVGVHDAHGTMPGSTLLGVPLMSGVRRRASERSALSGIADLLAARRPPADPATPRGAGRAQVNLRGSAGAPRRNASTKIRFDLEIGTQAPEARGVLRGGRRPRPHRPILDMPPTRAGDPGPTVPEHGGYRQTIEFRRVVRIGWGDPRQRRGPGLGVGLREVDLRHSRDQWEGR